MEIDLEAALVRELRRCYDRLSWLHFGDLLKKPVLVLGGPSSRFGQWRRQTRELELQRDS